MAPDDTTRDWRFLRSTPRERLGKLTLREDVWRLPTGVEKAYPILHVGLTVGVVPFVDRERVLLVRQFRHLARAGMASMWQTLLNLLTFHRDFASEAVSGRLRPGTGRGLAAFATDAVITVLAAIPTAVIAVLLEGGAVMARRGGVIEVEAERLPSTD